jgi:tetratricopeptide (TPR) repeat protein
VLGCALCAGAWSSSAGAQTTPILETLAGAPESDAEVQAAASLDDERYQALIADAVRAYRAGALIEARDLFSRAHALSPNARTLRGLGVVAFELRHYRQAIDYLEQSLSSQIKPLDEELTKGAEDLLGQARRHVGRFHIVLAPAEAELWLDGARVDPGPDAELVLEQGEHRLEFRHSGYVANTRSIEVQGREDLVLEVALQRVAPVAEPRRSDRNPARKSWLKSPWLWGALGVALVGGGVTAGVLVSTRDRGYDGGSTGKVVGVGR